VNTDETPEEPFNGGGPQNLSSQMLHQAWQLAAALRHQRQVHELTEALERYHAEMKGQQVDRLISAELLSRLNTLGDFLRSNIIGQDQVIAEIVDLLQPAFCQLRFPGRLLASMLFLGPTGTGKTETAQLFTRHLFGSADKLVRIDLSEYIDRGLNRDPARGKHPRARALGAVLRPIRRLGDDAHNPIR